jgi:23S rRNA pseudouridine2605 synthase
VRLAKYLAHAGAASRRASEDLIRAGRVTVNGDPVTDPATNVTDDDRIELDGTALDQEPRVVYMLNKPKGVVSTASDTHGRPTVTDLISSGGRRLYPVGRLDQDTTGLILLTNDGELANRLMHPSYEVPRTYRAKVEGAVKERDLRRLREGIGLADGSTAPAKVRQLAADHIELTIHEGRKRQVRRMLEAVGHPVKALERTALGPLRLENLEPGEHRELTPAEVERLWKNQPS